MHWQVVPWADAARGMFAAGTAPNGDLVVLSTGHANTVASRPGRGPVTPTWISHSANGGRTWSLTKTGFPTGPGRSSAQSVRGQPDRAPCRLS